MPNPQKNLLQEGKKGITADFNGVISKSADAKQGAAVTQGMELFTLQNTDKVKRGYQCIQV